MKEDAFKSLFPIKYPVIWDLYKKHVQTFWTAEEISFQDDRRDYDTLSEGEKHFVRYILAFFANSEALVAENLAVRFFQEITIPEARCFFGWQIANEDIHAEAYALQIEEYTDSEEEREELFDAINSIPAIAQKAKWAEKWLSADDNILKRLLAFGFVEGMFFAGSFCAIYYFRKRGLLPGLAQSNDWIARDEGLHFSFSGHLFKTIRTAYLQNDPKLNHMLLDPSFVSYDIDQAIFETITKEAVEIEMNFIKEAIPMKLLGMNSDLMTQYIQSRADDMAHLFGYEPIYHQENPFDFMRALDVPNVTNFFEKKVTDYQRPKDRKLSFDEEF